MTYYEILTSARPLHTAELVNEIDKDVLRQLIVDIKERELKYDIRYNKLLNSLEKHITDDEVLAKILNDAI